MCEADICRVVNEAYLKAPTELKIFLIDAVKRLRSDLSMNAEELANRLGIARSSLFNYVNRLGIRYRDLQEALKAEAEERLAKKLEKKEIRRALPASKQEFLERTVVQNMRNRMIASGKKPAYVNRVINAFWRLCKHTGLSPEDFVEMPRESTQDRIGIYDIVTSYISDLASTGVDVNNVVRMLQSIQLWLGVKILPPGVKQKEYKGKYQEAEIPLEVREAMVKDLLEMYRKTGYTIYLRTIQAMIIMYYTASRRQGLTNFIVSSLVEVEEPRFVQVMRTNRFRIIVTTEKKDLRWEKLIPAYYDGAIPRKTFSPSELKAISKIMRELLDKYIEKLNTHTKLYIQKKKVFHIWRHTATREYLRALGYNRSLVAKLLGWIKDSNLVIYGDFTVLQLLRAKGISGLAVQEHLDFVRPELRDEIIRVIQTTIF